MVATVFVFSFDLGVVRNSINYNSWPVDHCASASQRVANHRGAEGNVHFDFTLFMSTL